MENPDGSRVFSVVGNSHFLSLLDASFYSDGDKEMSPNIKHFVQQQQLFSQDPELHSIQQIYAGHFSVDGIELLQDLFWIMNSVAT